jgi:hypothetical protein
MSKSDTMFIAFPNGGILPAGIAGPGERKIGPHEPVRVPNAYGEHLLADRFAYEAEAPKKAARKPEDGGKPADLFALEDAVKAAEAAVAAASDDDAKTAAEAELAAANLALAKAKG